MKKGVQGPLAKSRNSPPPEFVYAPPPDTGLAILHQDHDILVLSKPANLLTVPGKEAKHNDSLETRVCRQFPHARTVHRLDRGTSGVVIMALSPEAHRHLGLQFEKRQTSKTYQAVVSGTVEAEAGVIELPLRTDWYNRPKQMVDPCLGREAITRWQLVRREPRGTRMELKPVTGRSHQLRVHMQSIGHPILGDSFYNCGSDADLHDRLMLHAETLEFFHPANGERLTIMDPCPF